jgi:hypothetical protein
MFLDVWDGQRHRHSMSLKRLGVARTLANTDTLLTDVLISHFASVIITNLSETETASLTISIRPDNTDDEDEFAYILYNFPLAPFNTLETNRFALNANDSVYVRSSINDVSFVAEGIPQLDFSNRYTVGNVLEYPTKPLIGDQFYNTTANRLDVYTSTGWRTLAWDGDES